MTVLYGFGEELTKDNLYKKISSFDIFKYYCRNFSSVKKQFASDLRVGDNNPSACIAFIRGDLMYTDFGTGKSYRAIPYVMEKFGLSYRNTLEKINSDFGLELGEYGKEITKTSLTIPKIHTKPDFTEKLPTIIDRKIRKFNAADEKFWGQYGIKLSTLRLFNIDAISHFWINGRVFKADDLCYSYNYYLEKGVYRRKIYQPYNTKGFKFISNGGLVVAGEIILPREGELLIITKAFKDVLCLYELGYTAIAPTSETSFVPEQYFYKQKSRFENIVLLYDSDNTGIKFSKEFSVKYNIPYIIVPYEKDVKDISDYVKKYGIEQSKQLLTTKLKIYGKL